MGLTKDAAKAIQTTFCSHKFRRKIPFTFDVYLFVRTTFVVGYFILFIIMPKKDSFKYLFTIKPSFRPLKTLQRRRSPTERNGGPRTGDHNRDLAAASVDPPDASSPPPLVVLLRDKGQFGPPLLPLLLQSPQSTLAGWPAALDSFSF